MTNWDERFRNGDYPSDPDPSPVLESYLSAVPDGRALDVATGTGRNALFLAANGYVVDALDQSRVGLQTVRTHAKERDLWDRVNLIQADVPTFSFPEETYDLITISFYRAVDRFPDIKDALAPGGWLFVEHHLRSADDTTSGPSTDRYRFAANELLHACLDLTVLYYDETMEERDDGRMRASTRILARQSSGPRQSYPRRRRHAAGDAEH